MARVTFEIALPDELLQAWLQHVRNFDLTYDPERVGKVHLNIGIQSDLDAATVQQIFASIKPPFEEMFAYISPGKA
jgi:hypothetical protein